jgi:transcription initiation factor TFIIB
LHYPVGDHVTLAAAIDNTMRLGGAASTPHKKGQMPRISTALVDATLRLGPGPGTEGGYEATIASMAVWLGLSTATAERAHEVFRKMEGAWSGFRGWSKVRSSEPLYAACLSIACRSKGSPRSLKELAPATAERGAAARVEISRLAKHIRRRLGEEAAGRATGVGVVRASGYMRRFCKLVGMGDGEATAAMEAARRLEESDLEVPHNGESVAAGVVCLGLERAGAERPDVVWAVAAATGVSTTTINNVCRKLRPHAELLFG